MEPQAETPKTKHSPFSIYLKCGALLILFLLSVLVVACGGGTNAAQTSLSNQAVTVTIHLGDSNTTPLPNLPPYSCGAWATNTSPAFNANSSIAVYAKYIHNVDGNPEGIGAASATATIHWGDGTEATLTTNTTSDGLAVFMFSTTDKGGAVGKISLVTVTFAKDGTPGCSVGTDRAAFFTLVIASPTASGSATATGTPNGNGNGGNGNGGNGNGNGGGKKKHGG